jgi:hypothetical protein
LTAVVPASLLQSSGTGYLFVETGDQQGILQGASYVFSNIAPFIVVPAGTSTSGFSPTGSMITARMLHSANLLPDGRVLVAGGGSFGSGGDDCEDILALDSAEIYDPTTGVFSSTGKMVTSRFRHTATALPNGKVLIAGGDETVATPSGYCSEALNSTELFDPAAGSFSAAAPMHRNRSSHTATLLPDGRVLVAGGSGGESTAEIYDPSTSSFSDEIPMIKPRAGHAAVLLPDGEVLLTGGCGAGCVAAELYDPSSNSFHATGDLTTERTGHTATLLPDGKALITGGRIGLDWKPLLSAEIYDPATRSFSATGSMQLARWDHRATLLPKGSVLITGNDEFEPSSTGELYDPATGQFTTVLLMNAARGAHTSTVLPDGHVLVAGGGVASAELYP